MNDLSLFSLIGLSLVAMLFLFANDVDDDEGGPPDGGLMTPVYSPT